MLVLGGNLERRELSYRYFSVENTGMGVSGKITRREVIIYSKQFSVKIYRNGRGWKYKTRVGNNISK